MDKVTEKPRKWLEEHDAKGLWQTRVKGVGVLSAWSVNSRVVLWLVYDKGKGWEMFTALDSNDIGATLLDVGKRVGLR